MIINDIHFTHEEDGCKLEIKNPNRDDYEIIFPDKECTTEKRCDIFVINKNFEIIENFVELKKTLKPRAIDQLDVSITRLSNESFSKRNAYVVYINRARPQATTALQRAKRRFSRNTSGTKLIIQESPLEIEF